MNGDEAGNGPRRSVFARGVRARAVGPAECGAALLGEGEVRVGWPAMYGAPGPIEVAYYDFGAAPAPAAFVVYVLPPGTGEGEHRHVVGEAPPGPFDEYYYVIAGEGVMTVEGEAVALRAGDMLRAPPGCAHGLMNTGAAEMRVFLCFISRAGGEG